MSGTANFHDGTESTNHSRYATDFTLATRDSNLASNPPESRSHSECANVFAMGQTAPPQLLENERQMAQHPFYHRRLELGNKPGIPTPQPGQRLGQGPQTQQSRQEYHGRARRSRHAYYHNQYPQINEYMEGNDTQFQSGYYKQRPPAQTQSQMPAQYVNPSALPAPAPEYTNPIVPEPISGPPPQLLNADMQRTYYNARMADPIFMAAAQSQSVNADMQHTYYNARVPQR